MRHDTEMAHHRRDASSQERKRMLFAAMTHHGSVFWADFLDLQAQGPVPWRREIGDAIQSASKFVAVIDLQYLLSFNCLEVRILWQLKRLLDTAWSL